MIFYIENSIRGLRSTILFNYNIAALAYALPLITLFAVIFDDSTQTRYLMGVLRQQDKSGKDCYKLFASGFGGKSRTKCFTKMNFHGRHHLWVNEFSWHFLSSF